jgi:hypothetical protein
MMIMLKKRKRKESKAVLVSRGIYIFFFFRLGRGGRVGGRGGGGARDQTKGAREGFWRRRYCVRYGMEGLLKMNFSVGVNM